MKKEIEYKILIPISNFIDKDRLVQALHILSKLENPLIVLFHVVEVPSRTVPVNGSILSQEIQKAKEMLNNVSKWLAEQNYEAVTKVIVARNAVEGIVEEANSGNYSLVIMLKRKVKKGLKGLFHKSISEAIIRSVKCLVIIMLAEK
ncbi:MAG: universal stress protein, partial [Candidatus Bathyarchaeia archaeon]